MGVFPPHLKKDIKGLPDPHSPCAFLPLRVPLCGRKQRAATVQDAGARNGGGRRVVWRVRCGLGWGRNVSMEVIILGIAIKGKLNNSYSGVKKFSNGLNNPFLNQAVSLLDI